MSRINLLPWRAELRARQKKQFLATLAFSALVGALVSGMIYSYYSSHVSGQEARNKYLEDQIALGEKKIEEIKDLDVKKQRLLSRKEVIDTLQADRSRVVRLFESLVKATPEGVVLTLVKQNEQGMSIEGRTQSNTRVSTYMRNLEASGWMKNPELSVIEATKSDDGFEAFPFEFKLSVGLAKAEEMPAAAIVELSPEIPATELLEAAPLEGIPLDSDPSQAASEVEGSSAGTDAAEQAIEPSVDAADQASDKEEATQALPPPEDISSPPTGANQ